MSNRIDQDDFVAAGFARLDERVLEQRAPKIKWGEVYRGKTGEQKVAWAEKVASTMNQAAARLQQERDELAALCEKKEEQLESLKKAMDQNHAMLVSEMTKLNEERQQFLTSIADLKRQLREHGDHR